MNHQTRPNPVPPGTATTVKEILGQVPDLSDPYERTFDEHARCLPCAVTAEPYLNPDDEHKAGGWISVLETTLGVPDPVRVGRALGKGYVEAARVEQDGSPLATTPETRTKPGFHYFQEYEEDPGTGVALGYDVVRSRGTGRYYLRVPSPRGFDASNIVALYLVAFATGSLVRYHPGYWMAVVSRSEGDRMAPILSGAVSIVEEQFPGLVLERLS